MQKLRLEQGEAILDLLEQCHAAHHAFEQKECFEQLGKKTFQGIRFKKKQEEISLLYDNAIGRLTGLYAYCSTELDIPIDTLDGIVVKALPTDLAALLKFDTPARR